MKFHVVFMKYIKGMVIIAAIALLLCMVASSSVYADMQTVTVDGTARPQGNQAISRDNAIGDALRKAVEQAVGMMVVSETVVDKSELIKDMIYSKTQGYVKQYKIIKESSSQDVYLVTIVAVIDVNDLKNDLGALGLLQTRVGNPRTLFMVVEQHIGQDSPFYWWGAANAAVTETALKEEFLAKGFNVVDTSMATSSLETKYVNRAADLSDAAIRDIGRTMSAEIVIKGMAVVKEGPRTPGSTVGSYMADITASAIRVDNGQLLASGRGHGVARHVAMNIGENNALEQAGRDIGTRLIDQIVAKWNAETSGLKLTQLTIRGLKNTQDVIRIKGVLAEHVRGAQNVILRSYAGGVAVFDLSAASNAQQIGDTLSVVKIPDINLDILRITSNTLELSVNVNVPAKQ